VGYGAASAGGIEKVNNQETVIYALSYAGGSSMSYVGWDFPEGYRFCPLDYRGHGLRQNESPDHTVFEMAADMAEQIDCHLSEHGNPDFAVFGHSMGGMTAWYTFRLLKEKYLRRPKCLFISGVADPKVFPARCGELGSEEKVWEYLESTGRIPERVLHSQVFRRYFLPVILHDFRLMGKFRCMEKEEPVEEPICAFAGRQDELFSPEEVGQWELYTLNQFTMEVLEGSHFFLNEEENRKRMILRMRDMLREIDAEK
jgi:medium-chain acyl-[acyl-carrier-protein] hydrolase